jgi:hypothetical protein
MSSVWETLSGIDVSEHTEEKNGLTYLSWAWAWGIVKKHYPTATYDKHLYDGTNGKRAYMLDEGGYGFVAVTVTIEGSEQTEVMPVLNHANKAVQNPDSFQVNTALQRCLAKCCAMHGLGHYIYAGEDLPEGVEPTVTVESSTGEKKDVKGMDTVAAIFNTFIPECKDLESLRGFWGINKGAIETLKKGDEKLYEEVLENFQNHAKKFETDKGEAA